MSNELTQVEPVGAEKQGYIDKINAFKVDEVDIQELLRTLWRRRMVIISTTILLTALVTLVTLQLTPRYTASANVMLETRQSNVVDIESVVSGMSAEMATVLSEVEVIRSTSLIRRVVEKLNLVRDPEFNSELAEKPWFKSILDLETYFDREILVSMGLRKVEIELSEQEAEEELLAKVVENVKSKLSVSPVRRSLVITIAFTSTNPKKAALIANTVADNYIVDQLEAKFDATRRASSWLNDRIAGLRDKVQKAEAAVETYRIALTGKIGGSTEMTTQQISELNSQLILARAKRAEANARLRQVEDLMRTSGDLASAAEVLNSPLIHRLRDQEAQVMRKVSELESRYGERHPKMIKAKAELKDLRKSIENEVRKIAQSLKNEMVVARARENTLKQNLNQLEGKQGVQNQASIKLNELEREAKASRLLYENFLNRFKETSEQQNLQQADARVISKADVPILASFPKKKLIIAVAFIGSAFLGVVLVFLLERLDNSFRSSDQLELYTGYPAIGMIPLVTGNLLNRKTVGRYPIEKPASTISEAIRTLRTSMLLSDVDNPPKVVGVTSTVPSEGKSTVALWLTQVCAMSGQRALLIDCDLRRPSVHRSLDMENEYTLVEILAEECSLKDAIQKDTQSNMHVIPGKVTQANALDLLSSEHMETTLNELRKHFDMIVLDCPPVLAVSDAKIVGQLTDKMLYGVKWDSTPRGLVQTGLRAAKEAKIDLAGVVMTQVNVKKHAKYGYGDYGYYYGKYKDYYTT
ncbi:polysaccharide biosynthesis tyrosine autokinase [Terasakiella sp. A23]|uniref:GumC family protein n=1 Tax=Terasakiella sp. FCG-A23 TaxID=3080561 RepID=UPI002953FC8C|nr:polysaccharide biosynthesis tyrosine autokinase [Terasakiella sp. A23]MDV7339293.1 polysaccharide biosynthesis tyrosine autokinase [Terasakiella sp. A23]